MPAPSALVLAIGDDRPTLMLLDFLFSSLGYRVSVATDPTSSPSPGPELRPHLVLRATETHDDGLDALRAIKRAHPGIPVVVLTSRTDTRDTILALDAGADEYMTKPFDPAELAARCETILRRYRTTAA